MVFNKILILSPHLTFPIKKVSDKTIFQRASVLILEAKEVIWIGQTTIRYFKNGKLICEETFINKPRSKIIASIRTILFQSNYPYEKFIGENIIKRVKSFKNDSFDLIYCSFVYSAMLIKQLGFKSKNKILIETHNNELSWYNNLINLSSSFSQRKVAEISCTQSENFLITNNNNIKIIAISPKDYQEYISLLSPKNVYYLPVGID